jgi:hypothetical protein
MLCGVIRRSVPEKPLHRWARLSISIEIFSCPIRCGLVGGLDVLTARVTSYSMV